MAETTQNKFAKWLIGASRSGSATGALGEVGWTQMAFGVKMRKLMLGGRIHHMAQSRLAKKATEMMQQASYRSGWVEDVNTILEEYKLTRNVFEQKDWKQQIKRQMEKLEWQRWATQAESKEALVFYRKVNPQGPEPYLTDNYWAKTFCQARIGDEFKLSGKRAKTR